MSTSWSGMVGMTQRGEVDGCTAGAGVNEERATAVEFTMGIVRLRVGMFGRAPGAEQVAWDNYLREFDPPSWASLAATSALLAAGLASALACQV